MNCPPPSTSPCLPVFVYGTLRPGQKNYRHYLLGKTVREERATITGALYYVPHGGYPYLLPEAGTVTGDLMFLTPEFYETTLRDLDRLEEYDCDYEKHSVYLRRRATVSLGDGSPCEAWVYYWNEPTISGERIPGGDFTNRSER